MVSRIRNFFRSMERTVTFSSIEGADTKDARIVYTRVDSALVSFSTSSLDPRSETIQNGSIRVFLQTPTRTLVVGDLLALSDTNNSKLFNYIITAIDHTATGLNAKNYRTRIEAVRKV